MDSILEVILGDEEENNKIYEDDSIWIKDGDVYRGSTNVKLEKKINPGVYVADLNRENGLFCKKLDSSSDNLFKFTDSSVNLIMEEIKSFWGKTNRYKEEKLIHKRGILMYGYPGTGKTSTIELLSNDLIERGGVVFKVDGPSNLPTHINFLKYSFRQIEPNTPVITIIEDIDKYSDYETELLDFLDGKSQIDHHVVLMTTNDTTNLPNNLLRPSRVDLKVNVPLPDESIRREFLEFKKVPEKDIDELVNLTDKFSIADLKEVFICRYLLDYSVEGTISKIKENMEKQSFMDNSLTNSEMGI